jgi:DNA-binding NarL/FixJ family response regulator
VKLHRAAVLTKMGANSLAELARMAERLAVADAPRGGPVTPESRP